MEALCYTCKTIRDIVHTDHNGLDYCAGCVSAAEMFAVPRAMAFLAATVPYQKGDRVECRTGGEIFDGIGTVQDVSFELKHGGTPVYPSFRVILDEKAYAEAPDECWYTEVCMTKVKDEAVAK